MNGIMHRTIHEIAQYESGEENKSIFFHRQIHETENGRGNDNAGYRWHKKTLFVPGEVMVVPVHNIDKFLRPFTVCNSVKSKPVHQVFKEGPEESARCKSEKYRCIAEFQPEMSEVNEINNHRQVHAPDDQRMGFGEHFHITVPEKLRLTLVMNLLKLHFRGLSRKNSFIKPKAQSLMPKTLV